MANREALRELQSRLAARLQSSQDAARTANWLAVESGGQGFLLGLADAGEIFPLSALKPVPHTHSWFAGVANLRGGLHGVVDLGRPSSACAARHCPNRCASTPGLVALNPSLGAQCALLVERLAGLRLPDQLEQVEGADDSARPAFAGPVWRDAEGRAWQELNLSALARHEQFLGIAS
jgi:Chemotaxis signal transduction protein